MSGCAKAAIIGGIVVVLVVIAALAFVFFGIRGFVNDIERIDHFGLMRVHHDDEAYDALGEQVSVETGDSALGAIWGSSEDTRLLEGEPFCIH